MRAISVSLLALLLLGCGDGRRSQNLPLVADATALPGQPCNVESATECRIVGFDEVVLSTRESEPLPVGLPAMDSGGRTFLGTYEKGVVGVWGPDGTFIRRLGREGQGPGEISGSPSLWVDSGDTLHAMDNDGVWTVFGPDLEYVRRVSGLSLPFFRWGTFLGSGLLVAAYGSPLFRVVDKDGAVVRSFGTPTAADNAYPRRVVSAAPDSGVFWAIAQYKMVLEEWSIDGTLLRSIDVQGSIFPDRDVDYVPPEEPIPDNYPPPTIVDLQISDDGVAWVSGALPDPRGYVPMEDFREGLSAEHLDRTQDFFIEAISLETGRVLASHLSDRLDGAALGFVRGVRGYRYGDDGLLPRHSLVRLALRSVDGG